MAVFPSRGSFGAYIVFKRLQARVGMHTREVKTLTSAIFLNKFDFSGFSFLELHGDDNQTQIDQEKRSNLQRKGRVLITVTAYIQVIVYCGHSKLNKVL